MKDSTELLVIGVLSLAVGYGFVKGVGKVSHERPVEVAGGAIRLEGAYGVFDFVPATGRLTLRNGDKVPELKADLALVVDDELRPIALRAGDVSRKDKHTFEAHFPVELPSGRRTHAILRLRSGSDEARDLDTLSATLTMTVTRGEPAPEHVGLRLLAPTKAGGVFVAGVGEIADIGTVSGRLLTLDLPERKLGIIGAHGPVDLATSAEPDGTFRASIGTPKAEISRSGDTAEMLLVAGLGAPLWSQLYKYSGEQVYLVNGVVAGTSEQAAVYGLDSEGLPRVRTHTDDSGHFSVSVPKNVTQWYAAVDTSRASPAVHFVPGAGWELRLDVSPGGELVVNVTDPDAKAPLTARLFVHGIDGTLDPSFGPDYRASGAGPIVDALHGDMATPLPAGHYRVSASHGLEWSIDAQNVEIIPGHQTKVALQLRHVVATPGSISADLHVHARPSFDSPVLQEDRVLSLVAAGIDFAVPTEHNIVGDYSPSIQTLGVKNEIASVPGIEVTTFSPSLGHFGVFPYPIGKTVPYRNTNVGAIFAAVHEGDPSRVLVVHHPRLQKSLGYFSIFGFDDRTGPGPDDAPKVPPTMRTDFDALEVFNGYEMADPQRVEMLLRDYFALLQLGHFAATGSSDSHRIQYNWAGYPRTIVEVDTTSDGTFDTAAVVSAIKHGRMTVTSGPVVDFRIHTVKPGGTAIISGDTTTAHVRVEAAPWIDVTSIEIVASGKSMITIPVPSRPTTVGHEDGTLAEAQARAVRYEGDIPLTLAPDARWIVAIARGTRKMDDVLPFMPIVPSGFTNPIYLDRGP